MRCTGELCAGSSPLPFGGVSRKPCVPFARRGSSESSSGRLRCALPCVSALACPCRLPIRHTPASSPHPGAFPSLTSLLLPIPARPCLSLPVPAPQHPPAQNTVRLCCCSKGCSPAFPQHLLSFPFDRCRPFYEVSQLRRLDFPLCHHSAGQAALTGSAMASKEEGWV